MGSHYNGYRPDEMEIYENTEAAAGADQQEFYEEPMKGSVDNADSQQHMSGQSEPPNSSADNHNYARLTVKLKQDPQPESRNSRRGDVEKQGDNSSWLMTKLAAVNWKIVLPVAALVVCLILAIAALAVAVSKTNNLQQQVTALQAQVNDSKCFLIFSQ